MPDNKLPAAPLPRNLDEASFSELVPFRSKKIKLLKSPIFWFVGLTALFNVALFTLRVTVIHGETVGAQVAAFDLLVQVALFYLLALALLGFHSYARSDKPILYYAFPAVFVVVFMHSPLWNLIYQPFDVIALGNAMETSSVFPIRLWSGFAGPGLREELVKGLPALIGASILLRPSAFAWMPARLRTLLQVRGPLDGVLMGFAAGCGFLFAETGGQYVHQALQRSVTASQGNLSGAFGDALMLLLPRVMNGWVGHMAWAGITGYFIGLAVIRPRNAGKLVAIGWVAASALHGLWDSSPPGGEAALVLIGGAGGLLAIACLVKARQVEASQFGRSMGTFGSIVVPPGFTPASPAAAPAPSAPSATPAMPAAPAAAPAGLVLEVAGLRLPLRSGGVLDLGALLGRGGDLRAEVTQHPTKPGVLGLKNLGGAAWQARLRDGTVQPVEAQRSLRLAAGTSIEFGAGLAAQVVAG